MAKIIIFGIKEIAEIAHFYIENTSEHEVVAFSVHNEFMPKDRKYKSLPVVAFEEIEKIYPSDLYKFFAPMSSAKMNILREKVFNSIKKKEYDMISYISSKAIVADNVIVGKNCLIGPGVIIEPFSIIGDNVIMWGGSFLGHHGVVHEHVTITGQVAIAGMCNIGKNSFLGVNSTIRNGLKLREGTLVGLGSVISKSTKEWSVYMGNPAKIIGRNISKKALNI